MRKLNIVSIKLPKKQLENAVKALQLYYGSENYASLKAQEKLYNKAKNLIEKLADGLGMEYNDVYSQVSNEANKRGKIRPVPGKDI